MMCDLSITQEISVSNPGNANLFGHEKAPLGSVAEPSSGLLESPYHLRFDLLRTARRLLPNERIAQCQNHIAPNRGLVAVQVSNGTANYRNLIRCESPSCPYCNAARSEEDRHELSIALAQAERMGYTPVLVTATLRHSHGDNLVDLVAALKDAWNKVFSGRFYMGLKDEWGVLGKVAAHETTYGKNGFHPHIHAIFFLQYQLSPSQIAHFRDLIAEEWLNALGDLGYSGTWENAIDVRTAESDIAAYIAKYGREPKSWVWGADSELAKANMKQSSHDGLTPLELLGAAAGLPAAVARFVAVVGGKGDLVSVAARASRLWIEYYWAMKGRARLHWGKMKHILELDDALYFFEQENPRQDDSYTMVLLFPHAWRQLKRLHLEGDMLLVAAAGQPDKVKQWMIDRGIAGIIPDGAYEVAA